MDTLVKLERDGDAAIIVIDNPPVNAGSAAVRRGLLDCIAHADSDPSIAAIVLIGAGGTFIAGSDLREFGKPLGDPQLPDVIAAIESCGKPVVAALHGAALGGGYELALGCDARVALPGTVVGLPEVTLGMIPGAGGTQRLPRLVGAAKAIDLICLGKRVEADEALSLGMIDAIAPGGLRPFAVAHARSLAGTKRRVRDLAVPGRDAAQIRDAARAALKAGRGRPQVEAAIASIIAAGHIGIDTALAEERRVFHDLRLGTEAAALRHLFFAERESLKHPEFHAMPARPIERIAVIGAGTMGTGIVLAALGSGFNVALLEQDPAALSRSNQRIHEYFGKRIAAGRIDRLRAQDQLAHLEIGTDDAMLEGAHLAIEAVYEDLSVKRAVLHRIEPLLASDAILASNTSYIDLDAIAEAVERPQNVVGLHFFSPAQTMRLLEVVRGVYTAPEVLATGFAVARRMGKLPILSGNAFGFIGNRIYSAYRRQCEFMLEEGALPEEIDTALEAFGFAMGPFAVADLSGLDIAWRMRQATAATRDPQARYVRIPDILCELNRLGKKTGAGYYRYVDPHDRGTPDPEVARLILQASADKGIARRAFTPQDIQARALMSMANEAALLLQEGVTSRASDIDLAMVNGFGFPKWEGGPVFWACRRDRSRLRAEQDALIEASGPGAARGDLDTLRRLLPRNRLPASLSDVLAGASAS